MKKIFTTILMSSLIFVSQGQNIKKEKVSSSVLVYPQVNISNIDVNNVKGEFCKDNVVFGDKKVQKKTGVCTTKDNSLKNAKAIDVFYYKVKVNETEAFLKLVDDKDETVYMTKTQDAGQYDVKFGDDKCYWVESILASAYKKEAEAFKQKESKESLNNSLKNATAFLNQALFFNYESNEINVYHIKGKDHNYADINAVTSVAVEGYKLISGDAENAEGIAKLEQAVKVWDAALGESNPKNKDSKVNKKVTIALAENSATAKMYLMQYDDALKTIEKALTLEQNFTTNGTERRKALKSDIKRLKRSYDVNSSVKIDMTQVAVKIEAKGVSNFEQFKKDYNDFTAKMGNEIYQEEKQAYEEGVSSGEINPYAALVLASGTNGKILTLPDLTAKMMGTFGGEKLDEIPLQVCELTDLTNLKLRGNNIKDIRPEIVNLTSLKQLNLSNNNLTHIPEELQQLSTLKTLVVIKGNNIPQSELSALQKALPNLKIK